jgi:hypothetical protein
VRRPFPPRQMVGWARDLLREIMASDPSLGKGLARFGTWQSLAAILGTGWLPLPPRASAGQARVIRQRLRELGAERSSDAPWAEGQPVHLRGTCAGLAPGGGSRSELWRATVVEETDGLWAVDEGEDFLLRDAGGPTLVLAARGRLTNAARLRPGDEVMVFGLAGEAPDRLGLLGAPHGRGGFLRAIRSGPSHPLLVSVIRRYDQEEHAPQD